MNDYIFHSSTEMLVEQVDDASEALSDYMVILV